MLASKRIVTINQSINQFITHEGAQYESLHSVIFGDNLYMLDARTLKDSRQK